jgi:hypothetical protein
MIAISRNDADQSEEDNIFANEITDESFNGLFRSSGSTTSFKFEGYKSREQRCRVKLTKGRLDIGKTAREWMRWNDVMRSVADIAPFVSCRCFTGLDDPC